MADITITAANVIAGTGATIKHGTAGAAVTAGQALAFDSSDSRYKLADNNSATGAIRKPRGIALHAASTGQPIAVHTAGPITIGATITAGVSLFLSDTPGGICPVADLATGEYPTILGIATSTTVLNVDIQESGVAL